MLFVLSLVAILIVISWVANYTSILARNYDNVFAMNERCLVQVILLSMILKGDKILHVKLRKTLSCVLFSLNFLCLKTLENLRVWSTCEMIPLFNWTYFSSNEFRVWTPRFGKLLSSLHCMSYHSTAQILVFSPFFHISTAVKMLTLITRFSLSTGHCLH